MASYTAASGSATESTGSNTHNLSRQGAVTSSESIVAFDDLLPSTATFSPTSRSGRDDSFHGFPARDDRARSAYGGMGDMAETNETTTSRTATLSSSSEVVAFDAEYGISPGSIIPLTYFHRVQGYALNESGEPITDASWLVGADAMPVAGKVDSEGQYDIHLLNQRYSDFFLVVEEEDTPDLTWYAPAENPTVEPGDDWVNLVFTEERVEISGGLVASPGVHLG